MQLENTHIFRINWHDESELILIDDQSTKPGDLIETYARWAGYPQTTIYKATVVEYKKSKNTRKLVLSYDQKVNKDQALDNDAWGETTLTIDIKKKEATAYWKNIPSWPPTEGNAPCTYVSSDLYEDLGYSLISRRNRRQNKFRDELLRLDGCCALTGDTTPICLEAAHIVEVKNKGAFNVTNGFLLRADLHKLFDAGILKIDRSGAASLSATEGLSDYYVRSAQSWRLKPHVARRLSNSLNKRQVPSKK